MRLTGLKAIRVRAEKTQEQAAHELDVPLSTYQGWEQLKNNPEMPRFLQLADYFGVTMDELAGRDVEEQKIVPMTGTAPIYGRIAAGDPIEMVLVEDEVDVPRRLLEEHPGLFGLRVLGDSMNRVILSGHIAVIAPLPGSDIQNGSVVAVNVNGEDATLKVITREPDSVTLSPSSTNPEYKARVINKHDPDAPSMRILGKMVWQTIEY